MQSEKFTEKGIKYENATYYDTHLLTAVMT